MNPAFDKPQFSLTLYREGEGEAIGIEVVDRTRTTTVAVQAHTGLCKLLDDRFGLRSIGDIDLYAVNIDNRWILAISLLNGPDVDLWYYTPSTVPYWLERGIKQLK